MLQEVTSPISTSAPTSTTLLHLPKQNPTTGSTENNTNRIGLSTNEITHKKFVRYTIFSTLSAVGLVVNFILFCVCLALVIYRDATSYEWGSFIWVFYIFIASIPLASFLECILFLYSMDKLLKLYVSHGNYRHTLSSLLHFLPYCYSFPILSRRNFYLKIGIYLLSIACFVISNLFVITAIILWFSIPSSPIPAQWWFIIIFVYSATYSVLFIVGWVIYLLSIGAQKWWLQRQQDRILQQQQHTQSPSTISTSTSIFPNSQEPSTRIATEMLHPISSLHLHQLPMTTQAILAPHHFEEEEVSSMVEAAAPTKQ